MHGRSPRSRREFFRRPSSSRCYAAGRAPRDCRDWRLSTLRLSTTVSIAIGIAMLTWPIVWPSPYLAAPVFLGFVFLLDPINARAGDESLLRDFRAGSVRPADQPAGRRVVSAAGSGSSGITGRRRSGSIPCRSSATSRSSRCQCSAISAFRRSRWNVSPCTSSCGGLSGAAPAVLWPSRDSWTRTPGLDPGLSTPGLWTLD